jgi:hypothetical protein
LPMLVGIVKRRWKSTSTKTIVETYQQFGRGFFPKRKFHFLSRVPKITLMINSIKKLVSF